MTELTCPKCEATMRQYERNGVTVDQCTGCRGVFLDRGELEHLISAEEQWNAAQYGAQPGAQYGQPGAQYGQPGAQYGAAMPPRGGRMSPGSPPSPDERYGYGGRGRDPRYRKRKKRSFLDDFLDF